MNFRIEIMRPGDARWHEIYATNNYLDYWVTLGTARANGAYSEIRACEYGRWFRIGKV